MEKHYLTLTERVKNLDPLVILCISLLSCIGFSMLYAAARGSFIPWAGPQMIRFCIGFCLMITIALIDIKHWLRWSYAFYGFSLILLILVELFGHVGMGAQRWIDLYFIKIQPSELMKIALILSLSCYFHRLSLEEVRSFRYLMPPVLMVAAPFLLVLKQPDLGTALLIAMIGLTIFFGAGVLIRYFLMLGVLVGGSIPLIWKFVLKGYQKKRVLTFLSPEEDPLGAGYHVMQSKIGIGSGGVFGKGFMMGTQSNLNFLPEKQTDFIFTMFSEEFGFLGCLVLLSIYFLLFIYGLILSNRCRSIFPRLVSLGVISSVFIYMFINMSMVMGIMPVVGVPLPFISYGGTSLLALMIGFGFFLNADVFRNIRVERYS